MPQHDPQARLIRAHFTVVFPAEASPDVVVGHTAAVCRRSRQIPFSLGHARAVRDVVGVAGLVFLLPEGGRAALVALHRPGGMLIADNVASHANELQDYLCRVKSHPQLFAVTLPIGNGEGIAPKLDNGG